MERNNPGISCAFYTVKQLAALFGKSEDTIRRWKNEGIGREEDNIKLRAVGREDGSGRKNARHLVFSREAVIDFVKASPFLMDDAPQLGLMMQAEGAWVGGALPMPGEVGECSEDEPEGSSARKTRETGFMAQVRRLVSDFDEAEDEGGAPFSSEHRGAMFVRERDERRAELPHFERRPRRYPSPPDFDPDEDDKDDEEDDFFHARSRAWERAPFEDWPEPEELDNKGWRKRMPRGGRGSQKAAEEELQRRMKTVNFALDVLRERRGDMEKQRGELDDALTELDISDMEEKTVASIRRVIIQKREELARQMDMLDEFVDVIEEEIKDE